MSISASTISLFVLLIPGLIFRIAVYLNSPIKRPFSTGNSLFFSITIVFYSVTIHFIAYALFISIVIPALNLIPGYEFRSAITEFGGEYYIFENNKRFTVGKFIIDHKIYSFLYFLYVVLTSIVLAYVTRQLSYRFASIGRLLYGPLAPLIDSRHFEILTCFVMTKIKHEEKHVAYAGFAVEVSLKDGSNIDHLVLESPEKYFVTLTGKWPKTTFNHSRPVSRGIDSQGIIYISGNEIENVHFESWDFNP